MKVPGWTRTAAEGKILYEINKEHPLIIQFKNDLPDEKQRSFKDLVFMIESSFPTELFYSDVAKNLKTSASQNLMKNRSLHSSTFLSFK